MRGKLKLVIGVPASVGSWPSTSRALREVEGNALRRGYLSHFLRFAPKPNSQFGHTLAENQRTRCGRRAGGVGQDLRNRNKTNSKGGKEEMGRKYKRGRDNRQCGVLVSLSEEGDQVTAPVKKKVTIRNAHTWAVKKLRQTLRGRRNDFPQ